MDYIQKTYTKKDDTRFLGSMFLAHQNGNILIMVWTYLTVQMNLFGSKITFFDIFGLKSGKYPGNFIKDG